MKNTDRQEALAEALARFKAGTAEAPRTLREEIAASWERSRKRWAGAEPVPGAPGRAQPHALTETLVGTASPVMEEYASSVAGAGGLLLLVDPDGRLLRTAGARELAASIGLEPGADLSENGIGTGAVGLCLETREPCCAVGAEHYARALGGLAACAAPLSGGKFRFLGVFGAVFPLERWSPACAALLNSLAANINHQHHINDLLKDQETTLELLNDSVLIHAFHYQRWLSQLHGQ